MHMRSRVAAAGHFNLETVDTSAEDQIAMGRQCVSKLPPCWASIGKQLGAEWMIYGVIEKDGDAFRVLVKIQNMKKSKVERAVFHVLDTRSAEDVASLYANELYLKLRNLPVPQTR